MPRVRLVYSNHSAVLWSWSRRQGGRVLRELLARPGRLSWPRAICRSGYLIDLAEQWVRVFELGVWLLLPLATPRLLGVVELLRDSGRAGVSPESDRRGDGRAPDVLRGPSGVFSLAVLLRGGPRPWTAAGLLHRERPCASAPLSAAWSSSSNRSMFAFFERLLPRAQTRSDGSRHPAVKRTPDWRRARPPDGRGPEDAGAPDTGRRFFRFFSLRDTLPMVPIGFAASSWRDVLWISAKN